MSKDFYLLFFIDHILYRINFYFVNRIFILLSLRAICQFPDSSFLFTRYFLSAFHSPNIILFLRNSTFYTTEKPQKPMFLGWILRLNTSTLRYDIYKIQIFSVTNYTSSWLLDDRSNTSWSYSTSTFTFVRFLKSHYFLWFSCLYCPVL